MKVHSAYLQNQIPESIGRIKKSDQTKSDSFDKLITTDRNEKSKGLPASGDSLELSNVTQRVLSQKEKHAIKSYFRENERKFVQSYSSNGKSVNMEVMIGKKLDVRG